MIETIIATIAKMIGMNDVSLVTAPELIKAKEEMNIMRISGMYWRTRTVLARPNQVFETDLRAAMKMISRTIMRYCVTM